MKIYCCPFDNTNRSQQVRRLLERCYRDAFHESMPAIEKTPLGKPYFPARPDIWFSLTHTKTHVACAMDRRPVGIDIEVIRTPLPGVIRRTCAPGELDRFSFMELWTLKESYIKYTGNNRVDMAKLVFSGSPTGIHAPEAEVLCRLYNSVPSCQMAVCGQTQPPEQIVMLNYLQND